MAEGDYDRAGLLDGLDRDQRRTRLSVLESLATDGVDIASMRDAIDRGRLGLLLLERTLRPEDGHSLDDVCAAAELEADVVRRWFQALGRPISPIPATGSTPTRTSRSRSASAATAVSGSPTRR